MATPAQAWPPRARRRAHPVPSAQQMGNEQMSIRQQRGLGFVPADRLLAGPGSRQRGARSAAGDGRRASVGLWAAGSRRCGLSFSKDTLPLSAIPPSPVEDDPRRDVVTGPRESCPVSIALPWCAPGLPAPDAALLHAVSSATRATAAAIFAAPEPSHAPRGSLTHAQHSCVPGALSWSHSQWGAAGASNPHTPGS